MNRRRFLKFLGVGAAAGAVAPAILLKKDPASMAATLGEYHTYHSESDPEIQKAIDEYENSENQAGWVSYRFHYTVTRPPIRPWRLRHVDTVA